MFEARSSVTSLFYLVNEPMVDRREAQALIFLWFLSFHQGKERNNYLTLQYKLTQLQNSNKKNINQEEKLGYGVTPHKEELFFKRTDISAFINVTPFRRMQTNTFGETKYKNDKDFSRIFLLNSR